MHESTAFYATDALRGNDRRFFALHLARCERCRTDPGRLAEAFTALMLATERLEVPPGLRERILAAARADRRP